MPDPIIRVNNGTGAVQFVDAKLHLATREVQRDVKMALDGFACDRINGTVSTEK
jgi:hypothetical protein